jgi:hypothetical protein
MNRTYRKLTAVTLSIFALSLAACSESSLTAPSAKETPGPKSGWPTKGGGASTSKETAGPKNGWPTKGGGASTAKSDTSTGPKMGWPTKGGK